MGAAYSVLSVHTVSGYVQLGIMDSIVQPGLSDSDNITVCGDHPVKKFVPFTDYAADIYQCQLETSVSVLRTCS